MDLWSRWLPQVPTDFHVEDPDPVTDVTESIDAASLPVCGSAGARPTVSGPASEDNDDTTSSTTPQVATTRSPSPSRSSLSFMALAISSPNLLIRRFYPEEPRHEPPKKMSAADPAGSAQNENSRSVPRLPDARMQSVDVQLHEDDMALPSPSQRRLSRMPRSDELTRRQQKPSATSRPPSAQRESARDSMPSRNKRRSLCRSQVSQQTSHAHESGEWQVCEDRPDANGPHQDGDDATTSGSHKKAGVQYPCPFRRRNPGKFNVRDHAYCAKTSFGSLSELRHHVASYHRRPAVPHQCRRCKTGFKTAEALDAHLMLPKDQICDTILDEAGSNPEDGITDPTSRQIAKGEVSGEEGWTWEMIWKLIFPTDEEIPTPDAQPVIELVEVEQQFDADQEALKARLQETLRLFLPPTIESDYCRFLAGQLELAFDTHRANTMRKCMSRFSTAATNVQPTMPIQKFGNSQQPNLARRQKRRSRISTVLYSPPLPDAVQPPADTREGNTGGPPSSAEKQDDDTESQLFDRHETELAVSSIVPSEDDVPPTPPPDFPGLPFSQISDQFAVRAATKTATEAPAPEGARGGETHMSDYDSPRDSRDSGIGMPCEVCEMDSCQCREIILSSLVSAEIKRTSKKPAAVRYVELDTTAGKGRGSASNSRPKAESRVITSLLTTRSMRGDKSTTDGRNRSPLAIPDAELPMVKAATTDLKIQEQGKTQQTTVESTIARAVQGQGKSKQPKLRHQPKLRVKTKGFGPSLTAGDVVSLPASANSFSPQSFNQRALRETGTGVEKWW
ncbi:hypothetical protein B0H66DRAFT_559827 [Apodospora peruviana]|uniref:C2H2-type domain-containing protein n=1 Tax=Apodospora peruviana TaxID=516989 RepID=A0AAE0I0G2_9PEZI|nr:hypothetical protein B0H66DRAFT_559827 [Apodospora peruviana]